MDMVDTAVSERKYWDSYYTEADVSVAKLPSQFAVFALGEAAPVQEVVELGCGNGRDSTFFASRGLRVLGIDASEMGIAACRETATRLGVNHVEFEQGVVGQDDLWSMIFDRIGPEMGASMLYARFFLHALDESAQRAFLEIAAKFVKNGGRVAVEFRTNRDLGQQKVTAAHYRRFINPVDFAGEVAGMGIGIRYFVDGFGFAKYKSDDAHVARFILGNKNESDSEH